MADQIEDVGGRMRNDVWRLVFQRISQLAQVVLGVCAFIITSAWAWTAVFGDTAEVAALPNFSTAPAASPGSSSTSAPTSVVGSDRDDSVDGTVAESTTTEAGEVRTLSNPTAEGMAHTLVDTTNRTITEAGCVADLTAPALHEFFSKNLGPLIGWDNPHVYQLADDRVLWILHDSYVDYEGTLTNIKQARPQMQNVVLLQEGRCFHLIHGGSTTAWQNFEPGLDHLEPQKFLWPLGGEVIDGRLWVFWSETVRSETPIQPAGGITRHPNATWLASYDIDTLERLSFAPAPNPGVEPQFGFAVSSTDEFSYLFGNSNLLNLVRAGGFENGPHSATHMYVARVPRGQFTDDPEYWNGTSWSLDPAGVVAISSRFWTENTMQPRYLHGQWVSVVKRDGFFGNEIVIDVAAAPEGPWIEVERVRYEPRDADIPKNSYQPVILPWSGPDTGLSIVISENAQHWGHAVERLDVYRPAVFNLDWPELQTIAALGDETDVSSVVDG